KPGCRGFRLLSAGQAQGSASSHQHDPNAAPEIFLLPQTKALPAAPTGLRILQSCGGASCSLPWCLFCCSRKASSVLANSAKNRLKLTATTALSAPPKNALKPPMPPY